MLRTLFRVLGFLALSAGFAALIVDATRSIAGGRVLFFSAGDSAQWLFPASLAALKRAAEQESVGPLLSATMDIPTWLACGALGTALMVLGRGPRRRAALP